MTFEAFRLRPLRARGRAPTWAMHGAGSLVALGLAGRLGPHLARARVATTDAGG